MTSGLQAVLQAESCGTRSLPTRHVAMVESTSGHPPRIAVMFPGQGAQYPGMGAGLYGVDDEFTRVMDSGFQTFEDSGNRLRSAWLSGHRDFDDVTIAQPLLYLVNFALGRMVQSWGFPLDLYFGHSVGEFVAATLAGVIDFPDGVRLMRDRVQSFAETPPGGMAAVAASVDDVEPFLNETVHIAAVNASRQVMIGGRLPELGVAVEELEAAGITAFMIPARQAFHTPLVMSGVERSLPAWASVSLRPPQAPLVTAYPGESVTPQRATDPGFWACQPAQTLDFKAALDTVLERRPRVLLEAGPGRTLLAFARRHPLLRSGLCDGVSLLPGTPGADPASATAARESLTIALGQNQVDS